MSNTERITREHALKVVSWDWLEDFAKVRIPDNAKQFLNEAKEAWTEEMLTRMNSGVFYGNESGEEQT